MADPTIPEDVIAARIEKGKELLEIERQPPHLDGLQVARLCAADERLLCAKV